MHDPRLPQLTEALGRAAFARTGSAMALVGGPGLGKSWLAAAALGALGCHSLSLSASQPLNGLVEALPDSPQLPGWVRQALNAARTGAELETGILASATLALLKLQAPFVLHVDDLHGAPPEVGSLLAQVAAGIVRTRGVVLFATGRHAAGAAYAETWLEPLDPPAAHALLERTVGAALPPAATDWIFGRAAGNPLFSLEYLRQLSRAGHLWSDGHRWHWRQPRSEQRPARVGAVIEYLVADAKELSAAAAAALEARALLPAGQVARTVWADVAGLSLPELQVAAELLARHGVMVNGDFFHGLVREVTFATLSSARRRQLGMRAVQALWDDPVRAAPYVRLAELPAEPAVQLLLAAADSALDATAAARLRAEASTYLSGPAAARLALDAARALLHADLPAALELLKVAATDAAADPEAVTAYAHALAGSGRLPEARRLAAEFGQRAGADGATQLLITSCNAAGAHAEALQLWLDNPQLHAAAGPSLLRAVAAAALAGGDMRLADVLLKRGANAAGVSPELRCDFLSLQALTAYHRGEFELALATIQLAAAELRALGSWRALSSVSLNRAAFLKQLGRFDEMNEALEECLELRRRSFDGRSYAFAQAALAELRIDQARFDEADSLLREALETLELYGPSRYLVNSTAMASALYLAKGDFLLAHSYAERALLGARELGSPRSVREILFDAASANARLGHAKRALALAAEMAALSEAAGASPSDDCRTRWAAGLALEAQGDVQAAADDLRAAQSAALGAGLQLEAHKIAIDLARVEADRGAAAAAVAWLDKRGLRVGRYLAEASFPEMLAVRQRNPRAGATEGQLRLAVLGPMLLGAPGAPDEVRGARRRQLLALLLLARLSGESGLTDLQLIDALYGQAPEPLAQRSLRQLVHQVRRRFGQFVVVRAAHGYSLGSGVVSDAEEFLAAADKAGDADAAGALRLWRGPFLQDAAVAEADRVAGRLVRSAAELARRSLELWPAEVARVARWLQAAEPFAPQLAALEATALRNDGDRAGALGALQSAQARLGEVGAELPAHIQQLLEELRA